MKKYTFEYSEEISRYWGEIIVEASDEDEARDMAFDEISDGNYDYEDDARDSNMELMTEEIMTINGISPDWD